MTKISCKLFEGRANSVDIYVHPKNDSVRFMLLFIIKESFSRGPKNETYRLN